VDGVALDAEVVVYGGAMRDWCGKCRGDGDGEREENDVGETRKVQVMYTT